MLRGYHATPDGFAASKYVHVGMFSGATDYFGALWLSTVSPVDQSLGVDGRGEPAARVRFADVEAFCPLTAVVGA